MMYHQRNAILKWSGIIFAVLLVGWFIWHNQTNSDEVWLNLQNVRNNDKASVQAQESSSYRVEESQKQSVKSVETARTEQGDSQLKSEETVQKIVVHCAGAVVKPGVYFLSADARVVDVVKAAGGVTGSADLNQINLAEPLTDGVKVYIPYRGLAGINEVDGSAIIGSSVSSDSHAISTRGTKGGRINLNTASVDELMTLPGIGASKAAAIIRYREEKGRFKKPEDLLLISGIGEKTFAKLKESVTI